MSSRQPQSPTSINPIPTSEPNSHPPLQRAGGFAAATEAITYLIGIALFAAYLVPQGFYDSVDDPAQTMDFMLDHQIVLYVWTVAIYLLAAAALVVLVLALSERLRPSTPGLAQTAGAFGLIWAGVLFVSGMIALVGQSAVAELAAADRERAISVWASVSVIHDATGGGIEIVGAIWVALIALAGWRSRALPRGLSVLGAVVAVAGTLTLVPALADIGAVFGIGFIVWFLWVARVLLRPAHR
ncbi:MAG: DUF4386 family protein [Ornithinimicrobium sp.]